MTESPLPEREKRVLPRSSMFVGAVMRTGTKQSPVKIRNMSPSGAMVETASSPYPGTQAELVRGRLSIRCTVIWATTSRCGLSFAAPAIVKDWLAAPAKAEQRRVDDNIAIIRAGGLPTAGGAYVETSLATAHRFDHQLGEDLQAIISLLEELEDDLASSAETVERHALKLQNIDLAKQLVRGVAQVLSSDYEAKGNAAAKLRDLRIVCAQALDGDEH